MTYKDWLSPNWRDDTGLTHTSVYKRKWALSPVICSDGEKVWFDFYYSKFRVWGNSHSDPFDKGSHRHTDFVEHITEAEYIVRKLAGEIDI